MRSALLPVLIMSTSACGGKKDAPAPSPATGSVAAVMDAAPTPPPPPPVDAAPPPRVTTRGGPWSIDVPKLTTIDKLTAAGFVTTAEWENSREPILLSTLIDSDEDNAIGLVAYTPRGAGATGKIEWLETYQTENAEPGENGAGYAAAGLCVEEVCPGQPAAAAEKLGVKTCYAQRIEMEFRYHCPVEGTPLAVIVEGDVPGAKMNSELAFAKIVKAKHPIHSLAWEVTPGAWQPMVGCTTDCD